MTTRAETEAEKMQQVPGIEFVDTPTGRMARPVGTGLRVWQIVKALRDFNGDRELLRRTFDWLSEEQIAIAFRFYACYPREIDERIAREHRGKPSEFTDARELIGRQQS